VTLDLREKAHGSRHYEWFQERLHGCCWRWKLEHTSLTIHRSHTERNYTLQARESSSTRCPGRTYFTRVAQQKHSSLFCNLHPSNHQIRTYEVCLVRAQDMWSGELARLSNAKHLDECAREMVRERVSMRLMFGMLCDNGVLQILLETNVAYGQCEWALPG